MISSIKRFLRKFGIDIIKYHHASHPLAKRIYFFHKMGINKILDVGANTGQYAKIVRRNGFKENIVSFEPLSDAFSRLQMAAAQDPKWQIKKLALGDKCEKAIINVSENLQSSSILDMKKSHEEAAPSSKYIKQEEIEVATLDSIFNDVTNGQDKVFLKIDVQGFEKKVIEGAAASLKSIMGIQLEMSLIPLYEGETLIADMINYMDNLGYTLVSLEHSYSNPITGQQMQADGIFYRKELL